MTGQDNAKKYFYSWQEFSEDIEKIAEWARPRNFKNIYGIPRGGLVLGVLLSYRLGIPLVLNAEEITEKTFVVDDIADTGETLEKLKEKNEAHFQIATIFYHKNSRRIPDFFLREKADWIIFPWETEASSKYDGTSF